MNKTPNARKWTSPSLVLAVTLLARFSLHAVEITPIREIIVPAIPDRQDFQVPDRVRLTGWVGERIRGNEANRLVKLDATRLLEGYRKRPGRQSWDGEHVGKWLHAATLAWVYTGDPALREKLDYIAAELVKCQMEDGYLGTYVESNRWRSWDVWAHKYNLLGLITYARYTGNPAPLAACRRMADLLCNTFGDEPGKRDIIKSGPQVGMAPTSVLEPMILLYRLTGEPRYLEFCKYILRAWEQPHGPKIISTLLTTKRVDKIGNGKAYEMISCFNGILEYYRTTGDPDALQACLNAWQDIVAHRLYITGAASYWEVFHDDYDLPNNNIMGETCVTVTWLQFNAQLVRLTGEARFADQLENVVLNQLLGAQRCDGGAWGYYVQMEGRKPYTTNLDGQCCLSSGPRGVALVPTFSTTTDSDGIVLNLYDAGTAQLRLRDGTPVTLTTATEYPSKEWIRIAVDPAETGTFAVKLRIPAWCHRATIEVNGRKFAIDPNTAGYVAIQRSWKKGDRIALRLKLEPRLVLGDHTNLGKVALLYGPLVLAADQALCDTARSARKRGSAIPQPTMPLNGIAVASPELSKLKMTPEPAPDEFKTWPGAQVFRIRAVTRKPMPGIKIGTPVTIRLIPFADAGSTGARYKVWLPLSQELYRGNLLLDGQASLSRPDHTDGSMTDEDFETFVANSDGKLAEEDWFAVELNEPVMVKRVVFAHGKTSANGGWFDATAGKPRVQVKRTKAGVWETVAEITDYPATTAKNSAEMEGGEHVICKLDRPIKTWGVRVVGKPASGDKPQQSTSSCAELQAFSE
ncbi:MAG: glycoside hydrolase family 127 protein [Verrucomicrobia subdivision 3 bacterium]|nr:glycoside hydrolase family 127 protein [Limisphaerales bacterium]